MSRQGLEGIARHVGGDMSHRLLQRLCRLLLERPDQVGAAGRRRADCRRQTTFGVGRRLLVCFGGDWGRFPREARNELRASWGRFQLLSILSGRRRGAWVGALLEKWQREYRIECTVLFEREDKR